jgi:NinB protein
MRPLVITGEAARKAICRHVLAAPVGHVVTIKEPIRNLDQNAKMWAMLSDLERQCQWHGVKLVAEEWKDLLSAGLVQSRVVPNLEGNGFVILGQRTSNLTKGQFASLIELIYAFGAERGVVWSDPGQDLNV